MDRASQWDVTDRDLHQRLRDLREAQASAALATVVDVSGSAYRRPGAKLVATAEETVGAITAGCLDGPVSELAADARNSGTISVETFDLTDDDWGLGLGCNGVIDILVEPLDGSLDPILAALDRGTAATALTVLDSDDDAIPVGARTVLTDEGSHSGTDRAEIPTAVRAELRAVADSARAGGTSTVHTVQRAAGDLSVFVDGIEPAPELLLFGAQQDINPIARLGARAGFSVTVASPRGGRADADQFPQAHRVSATHPTELSALVDDPARTYAVLLSHNLVDDRLALDCLLTETEVPYIGLMGPRKRFEDLRESADGRTFSDTELDRIATPVGLDLGDGSPTGVALSIVSEVLAASNDTDGGRLSERSGPIHPRPNHPQ
jgi:xanthine dehydrogenase accessory factor